MKQKKKKQKERNQIKQKNKNNDRLTKDRVIRDIRALFEPEEEKDYYKPKRESNFWNNDFIEHTSNGDKIETFHQLFILLKLNLT